MLYEVSEMDCYRLLPAAAVVVKVFPIVMTIVYDIRYFFITLLLHSLHMLKFISKL